MYQFPVFGITGIARTTAAANTAWLYRVEPMGSAWTGITVLDLTVGATAQTLYIMRPTGLTHLAADAAGGQAVIVLNADPGMYSVVNSKFRTADNAIAANDFVAFQYPDGTFASAVVSSVSGLNITLTANLGTGGLKQGAPVWFFGIQTDTNPYDGKAHPLYDLYVTQTAGALKIGLDQGSAPFVQSYGQNNPLLLYNANATNASVLQYGEVVYTQRPGPYIGTIPIANL